MQNSSTPRTAWWWLTLPLVLSCLGWIALPQAATAPPADAEGAGGVLEVAGLLAAGLTVPVTIAVLHHIGALRRMSIEKQTGIVFGVALPALAFLFCWAPVLPFVFGIVYAVIVLVTQPIGERNPGAATFAAFAIPAAIAAAFVVLPALLALPALLWR